MKLIYLLLVLLFGCRHVESHYLSEKHMVVLDKKIQQPKFYKHLFGMHLLNSYDTTYVEVSAEMYKKFEVGDTVTTTHIQSVIYEYK